MSQNFKDRIDRMLENDPGDDDSEVSGEVDVGRSQRSLLFILPDGNEKFLQYSYLVSGDFLAEENTIILEFTSHAVTLKGINLHPLYRELSAHTRKVVSCHDARYNALSDDGRPVVNEISIVKLGQIV